MEKDVNKIKSRSLIRPFEVLLFLAVIVVISMLFVYCSYDDDFVKAEIKHDGKIVKTIDLRSAENQSFTIDENSKVNFEIKDNKIRFINTDCPDKLCENVGFIYKRNQTAICLPNVTSIKIVSNGSDEVDEVVN